MYNDGYTIRGVQKVIKENGTKKLLRVDNESKPFTDLANDINDTNDQSKIVKYSINESKRKKLMDVLNDLVNLKNKLDNK